jgi:tetratricopeptide (TPR) repeat protein
MKKKQSIKGQRKELHGQKSISAKQPSPKGFNYITGLCLIISLGILIYSNTFQNSFHLDDTRSIVENAVIRDWTNLHAIWGFTHARFIPYFSFALNYHFGELNIWGYHFVNLMIHLINAYLVYWLTLQIFSSPALKDYPVTAHKKIIALMTALLFVSHPLATESITYIMQRTNSMMAMFYLLALVFYMKARLTEENNYSKYQLFTGAGIAALLAMFTKENAFTLPFAIVLIEIFLLHTGKLSTYLKDYRMIIFFSIIVVFISIVLIKYPTGVFQPLAPDDYNNYVKLTSKNYLFTQFGVILKYIQLLILPIHQNLDYDWPVSNLFFEPRTMLGFIALLSILILAVLLFKKYRIFSFGICWFFLTLSIESGIIPISDLIFEHRTYLPSIGFFLILTSGIFLLFRNQQKYVPIAVLALIILSNSFLTFSRNKVWKDDLSLWNDAILKSPHKARPIAGRADYYFKKGKIDLAISDYTRAIELNPNYYFARNNRGNIYKIENKPDEALVDYTKAIELKPSNFNPYNNRGAIYVNQRKYEEAIADLNKAIELKPDLREAYANRALAELNLGQREKSCADFKKAIDLGFELAVEAYNNNCR